ncbi:MAG: SDR family NAD(P)-dependent oxidoreductase [Phycisphaerae bacterium]|nr:SDR family NAD(P)-dependent oxidoreductase [Phycisphaerae bacterium]MDD5239920.1 SDR family NAD(P)-dependent oxidoreductase [Candidatus Nanoarchaeia archaeon]
MPLSNKTILIIGASGTLGQALIDELVKYDVHAIRCFSRNEHKQFLLRQKYGEPTGKMRYFIGDIRDKDRLDMAMRDCDCVFNFAAMKHVGLCNENSMETIKTNILGTQNAIECAIDNNVEVFVQMSTDKAVNPIGIYGSSKLLAEYLTLNAFEISGKARTRFVVVRSGNVLDSSGSVLEIWRSQKEQGLPLTVTDFHATRYAAPGEKIANAVLEIAKSGLKGLVVLDMKSYTMRELMDIVGDCEYVETGLKPYEKLHEELWRDGEIFTKWEV